MPGSYGSTPNPFKWNAAAGYQHVPFTGLYHVGAREYDPRTARWLQRDPIGQSSGDPNVYRYCGNDPINEDDPDGLQGEGLDIVTDMAMYMLRMALAEAGREQSRHVGVPFLFRLQPEFYAVVNRNINDCLVRMDLLTLPTMGGQYGGGTDYLARYADIVLWFKSKVETRGGWDYKAQVPFYHPYKRLYEDFGNFNYGATAAAIGVDLKIALRAAGSFQADKYKGHAGTWELKWLTGVDFVPGLAPYGDDPIDQYWIRQGYKYYQDRYGQPE